MNEEVKLSGGTNVGAEKREGHMLNIKYTLVIPCFMNT